MPRLVYTVSWKSMLSVAPYMHVHVHVRMPVHVRVLTRQERRSADFKICCFRIRQDDCSVPVIHTVHFGEGLGVRALHACMCTIECVYAEVLLVNDSNRLSRATVWKYCEHIEIREGHFVSVHTISLHPEDTSGQIDDLSRWTSTCTVLHASRAAGVCNSRRAARGRTCRKRSCPRGHRVSRPRVIRACQKCAGVKSLLWYVPGRR